MSVPLPEVAHALAAEAHAGQRRRHGAPYIDHPIAVAAIAQDLAHAVGVPFDDEAIATALLHDVIEDSPDHSEAVVAERLGPEVASRVVHLTKTGKGDAATAAYYGQLMGALPTTRLTKIADRLHNLSELHKAHDDDKLQKYVVETETFVRPLADGFQDDVRRGLHAALDNALDNARELGAVARGERVERRRNAGLYGIIQPGSDGAAGTDAMLARLDAILRGGVARVQLRVKPTDHIDDGAWLELVCEVARRAGAHGVDAIVNDRADLAFGARLRGLSVGVHVGDKDLPPSVARALLGPGALVGTSTHSLAQLTTMAHEGSACHLALGPIWASPTKQGHAAVVGDHVLAAACASTDRPVVAIGGITSPARAADVADAGAAFAAVVSALELPTPDAVHLLTRRFAIAFAAARAARAAT